MSHVLFVCDWDYTWFWTKVARILRTRGAITSASALVIGRVYYDELKKDPSNPFDRLYLLQDAVEHVPASTEDQSARLAELEARYGNPSIWRFLWADRSWVRAPYDEATNRMVTCFEFYEKLFSEERPSAIFANAYASMPHLISFSVARHLGIPIVRPMSVRMEDRYILSESDIEDEQWLEQYVAGRQMPSASALEEAGRYLAAFRVRAEKPLYQAMLAGQHRVTAGHLLRFVRYMYRYWINGTFANDHTKPNPFVRGVREATWRIRRRRLEPANVWDTWVPSEQYVYFPLHVQPEASTMTMAPFYLDQPSVIENISKSLPVNCRLVVKEHPSMLGRRESAYYDRIRALPNVRLVSPALDGFELTRNCALVFTITGTTALEAALLGRPSIMLGSTFFARCPSIVHAGRVAPTDWPELIRRTMVEYTGDDDALRVFLAAIFERSFRGNYVEPGVHREKILSDENLAPLVEALVARLHLLATDGATAA